MKKTTAKASQLIKALAEGMKEMQGDYPVYVVNAKPGEMELGVQVTFNGLSAKTAGVQFEGVDNVGILVFLSDEERLAS